MVEVDKLAMEIDNSSSGIGKNGMGKWLILSEINL